jgi:hypothetical protein
VPDDKSAKNKTDKVDTAGKVPGDKTPIDKTDKVDAAGKVPDDKTPTDATDKSDSAGARNNVIAALAMEGAEPFQKIIVYCLYAALTLGIIILGTPPYTSLKELVALGLILAFVALVAMFVLSRYGDLAKKGPPVTSTGTAINTPIPTPVTPPIPTIVISPLKCQRLITLLEETRTAAYKYLVGKDPKIAYNDIRANIFLPEYEPPYTDPDKYILKIYPGLHVNMDEMKYHAELGINFLPKQGATGNVFTTGMARVAQRLLSISGDWDDIYHITPEVAAIIHPALKWIISMPLLQASGKPLGVLNVDGLNSQPTIGTLYKCAYSQVTTYATVISGILTSP